MNESDISLWESLGLPGPPPMEPMPDAVWEAALAAATDPAAAPADPSLVPGDADLSDGEDGDVDGLTSDDDPLPDDYRLGAGPDTVDDGSSDTSDPSNFGDTYFGDTDFGGG